MVGGGKKRFNKSKGGKSSSSLFVQGGILSDWSAVGSPPSSGAGRSFSIGKGSSSKTPTRSESSRRNGKKGVSFSAESNKSKACGSAFGYVYPAQEGSVVSGSKEGNNLDDTKPIVLVDSGNTQVVAYFDQTPPAEPQSTKYTYEYSAGLGLDNTSHKGLGFSDAEVTPNATNLSLKMEMRGGSCMDSPSSEDEMETDVTYWQEFEECDDVFETPSSEKNSGYLSIGGMKLYTQDISDGEDDEEDGDASDGESLDSSGSEESYGSSDSEGSSESGSSIADEVAEDYFEGIGGSEKVVNADKLVGQVRAVDDDGTSGGNFNETLRKLGGIELQDASREYGLSTPLPGRKFRAKSGKSGATSYAWSSALDDLMLVKDYRTASAKKKRSSRFPQSWPSDSQKSKHLRKFPGEKKKHRKEMIALKRWDRMIRRGVDLEQINLKLQQMVLNGVDTLAFQPMHTRDCSQVRRLAAIYRLQSGCQGSGKKRFVTVIRTDRTCMPSSNDRIRIQKLIGASDEGTDFTVNDMKSVKGERKSANKTLKSSGPRSAPNRPFRNSSEQKESRRKRSGDKLAYAAQPMSFVSSGIMHSETEIRTLNMEIDGNCHENKGVASSSSYGAFELHTTGFGSKMMAKMGYVEGEGLGKDGQGRADPIEVVMRPKSLGLGANAPETSPVEPVKARHLKKSPSFSTKGAEKSTKSSKNEFQQFASFEKHTKGFGSKMMAKMGFIEGTGLGRDSQGIVNPLAATRLPKSRGLGARG